MPKPPFVESQLSKDLRPIIRETMQAAPSRRWTLKALHAFLQSSFPGVKSEEVNAALFFQEKRGNIHFNYNHETEQDEWYLTERGKEAK